MPWAECRLLFLSLRDSLLPPLSPSATANILRLRRDKGSSLTSSNYRGCRSGVCVNRLRASKKLLPIGLLNARSVASKPDVIHYHLLTFDLDVLAITETWLQLSMEIRFWPIPFLKDTLVSMCQELVDEVVGLLSFTVQRSVSIVSPLFLSHNFLSTYPYNGQ
jgi:hypothetical protein